MLLYGHRGASAHFPENTSIAFNKALESKLVDGVECDIQLLNSGHIIVLHDTTLDRTSYNKHDYLHIPVDKLDYSNIKNINIGNKSYSQNILLLQEFIELVYKSNKRCLIEIKGDNPNIIDKIISIIDKNPKLMTFIYNNIFWISFNLNLLKKLKLVNNKLKIIYIGWYDLDKDMEHFTLEQKKRWMEDKIKSDMDRILELGFNGIDLYLDLSVDSYRQITKSIVDYAKIHNLIIGVWVSKQLNPLSDNGDSIRQCDSLGIDFFTSDLPFIV